MRLISFSKLVFSDHLNNIDTFQLANDNETCFWLISFCLFFFCEKNHKFRKKIIWQFYDKRFIWWFESSHFSFINSFTLQRFILISPAGVDMKQLIAREQSTVHRVCDSFSSWMVRYQSTSKNQWWSARFVDLWIHWWLRMPQHLSMAF